MKQQIMAGLGLAVVAAALSGCGQTKQQEGEPIARHLSSAPVKTKVVTSALEVRDVAATPSAHLGHLTLSGVVGIVTPKKGFVLVDTREYQGEGFACLTKDEPTKIPVQWSGAVPKVKDSVRVEGQLVKTKDGYTFIAEKVGKA